MAESIKISGVIITFNEAKNISACIQSMKPVVDEVLVVDSYSEDNTVEICTSLEATVIQQRFLGHLQQKNFAMEQAKFDYILSLDADERLSPEMVRSVLDVKKKWKYDSYSFNRLNNYCGKWLRHSWYPDRKIRLWDRRKGRWGGSNPHDRVIQSGSVQKLNGDIHHYAYQTIEQHANQVLKFAEIAAQSKFEEGAKANILIHVVLGPIFKFVKRYILRFGFLDGYYGLVFSWMAAHVNFLKYSRLIELRRNAS